MSYIGTVINHRTKTRLQRGAKKLKLSLSAHVSNILADHVGVPRETRPPRDGRTNSGRRPSPRVVLTPQFRANIMSTGKSLQELSTDSNIRQSILIPALKGNPIPHTPATEQDLIRLAKDVGYEGKTYKEQ
jgi:hypothetical protein